MTTSSFKATTIQVARRAACLAAAAAVFAVAPGCSKKSSEPAQVIAAVVTPAVEAAPAAAPVIAHGTRKMKNLDVPVFVDGTQVSVLRYGELPSQLALAENPLDDQHEKRFFRLYEYLKAVGVDVEHVKAVHLAGTHDRVVSLLGSELRADKARFVFDFLEGQTGIASLRWETTGLKDTSRIEEIYAVNIFVAKPVAEIDPKKQCYVESDGECAPIIRFTSNDLAKGTRVYLDGKMVAYVKRRALAEGLGVGADKDGEPLLSVDKYLTSLGVNASAARGVELLAGDDVIARATGATWTKDRAAVVFALQRHSHGRVRMTIPANLQAAGGADANGTVADRDMTVTAIKVYRTTNPTSRALTAIDDAIDVGKLPNPTEQQAALGGPGGHARDNE